MSLIRKQICALVLMDCLDECDEEVNILTKKCCTVRSKTSYMFNSRDYEGDYEFLIQKHLLYDEVKFKACFRFTMQHFYY